jgi:Glycosyl transferase family 2
MNLSLIVSAFNRPEHLKLCLQALYLQRTQYEFEILVTDNGKLDAHRREVESQALTIARRDVGSRALVSSGYPALTPLPLQSIRYFGLNHGWDCYKAAEYAALHATGEFLGFPSDDNWYAPEFVERMLLAAYAHDWELVYCDALFDPRWTGRYMIQECIPELVKGDKGGFFIKRTLFNSIGGFPRKMDSSPWKPGGLGSSADRALIQEAASRAPHGRVPEVMWFHG